MKNHLMMCVLIFFTSFAFAKEDDCPSAVDAAEAQNPNAYKDCDYSKTGLNGALHKVFAKSKESDDGTKEAVIKESANKDLKEAKDVTEKSALPVEKAKLIAVSEFSSPQQLQALKFALLEKTALECTKGFVVEGERYLPAPPKATKLELIYHCL
jgi:hypothetical protein